MVKKMSSLTFNKKIAIFTLASLLFGGLILAFVIVASSKNKSPMTDEVLQRTERWESSYLTSNEKELVQKMGEIETEAGSLLTKINTTPLKNRDLQNKDVLEGYLLSASELALNVKNYVAWSKASSDSLALLEESIGEFVSPELALKQVEDTALKIKDNKGQIEPTSGGGELRKEAEYFISFHDDLIKIAEKIGTAFTENNILEVTIIGAEIESKREDLVALKKPSDLVAGALKSRLENLKNIRQDLSK